MSYKRVLASLLFLLMLLVPMQAFAETPEQTASVAYTYSNEEVLARGRLYYSYLSQVFSNTVQDYSDAVEITLTGAIGFSDTDYTAQAELDAKAKKEKINGPTIYMEYTVLSQNGESKTYYLNDLLPAGGAIKGGISKSTYLAAVKEFTEANAGATILGNGFIKDAINYNVRIDLNDYIAAGYPTTKTQVDAIRAAKAAAIAETPDRYYPNLEKLMMTRTSNEEINEVILCIKGIYTDDELAAIDYTDTSKIQYWMDYYTMNLNNQRLRVKKAYSLLGDLTVLGNAGDYNKMALIANGRNPEYTEIAPGMYRNADGWTVFRVDLNDYSAKGYVL